MNTNIYPPEIRAATMRVVHHIRALGKQEIQPMHCHVGMCWEVYELMETLDVPVEVRRALRQTTKHACFTWPHWSGYKHYPVPGVRGESRSASGFYSHSSDKWANNDYGDLRRSYCFHVANYLEGCLNNGRLYDAIA